MKPYFITFSVIPVHADEMAETVRDIPRQGSATLAQLTSHVRLSRHACVRALAPRGRASARRSYTRSDLHYHVKLLSFVMILYE